MAEDKYLAMRAAAEKVKPEAALPRDAGIAAMIYSFFALIVFDAIRSPGVLNLVAWIGGLAAAYAAAHCYSKVLWKPYFKAMGGDA